MHFTKRIHVFVFCMLAASAVLCAQSAEKYRITGVEYDNKGSTREFPLTIAVPISKTRIFADKSQLEYYLADLQVKFSNQRVLESSSIEVMYGPMEPTGIIPVNLVVHTVDTWNIIALPYPKYDSNEGFQLKLKLKDYNFFGSMQVLNGDLIYAVDNDSRTNLSANLDFNIPFQAYGYAWRWENDLSVELPQGEILQYNVSSGLNIEVPIGFSNINFGIVQSLVINDRDDSVLYEDDRYYFKDKFYTNLPVTVYGFDYLGDLDWTPSLSISEKWAFDGIQHPDLRGPDVSLGHTFDIGRFDWRGNFRTGLTASLSNTYDYNLYNRDPVDITVKGGVTAYHTLWNRIGLNAQITGFHNFFDVLSDDAGPFLRGILDDRIETDSAFTFNFDLPVRVMTVDFKEVTGVDWTRYIGFEMHVSPFFDMALTRDEVTGRYFALADGWYSGGLEIIIFPAKMRSIYGRISAGFDLVEVAKNGGQLGGDAERDGESIRELMIGIGLHY